MNEDLTFSIDDIKLILKSIAGHFGSDCEIVLHDFSRGLDKSIIAIENGHVTNRSVGSAITTKGLEFLSDERSRQSETVSSYYSTTKDGRILRSSSVALRDGSGQVKGSICINQDITKLKAAEQVLRELTGPQDAEDQKGEVFVQNVDQLIDHYIFEVSNLFSRSPEQMNKDELNQAIRFLEEKGVFKITKAGDKVCEVFQITKYQLYRQLDDIRNADKK